MSASESGGISRREEEKKEESQEQSLLVNECECVPKILLVDDTSFNLIPLKKFIDDGFGIMCVEANNGQEAFDFYKAAFEKECGCPNRYFKLVLMDI